MNDMDNWMQESGIPHDNGKIKWFIFSLQGDSGSGGHYVGEFDMTDWEEGWKLVFAKAESVAEKYLDEDEWWQTLREDQVVDVMWNVFTALHDAGSTLLDEHWVDWEQYKKDMEAPCA